MMLSQTEENYIKALFHLTSEIAGKTGAGTNELAANLNVKPATANDMLKKLKEKKLIHYEKYGKITLAAAGRKQAIEVIRKHRLWETFLYEKLHFSWDEVHEVAEQKEKCEVNIMRERNTGNAERHASRCQQVDAVQSKRTEGESPDCELR